ncbi:hypothetical protein EXN66_Car008910 [Channa argus]|uniref:Uncharacterized protein n=1 Tax=Channa argus TaxID=215402 RepID=A0A6G1PSW9_CHAAH|nr:hypothetical protein EXN66_Car008910 [Channa argus]
MTSVTGSTVLYLLGFSTSRHMLIFQLKPLFFKSTPCSLHFNESHTPSPTIAEQMKENLAMKGRALHFMASLCLENKHNQGLPEMSKKTEKMLTIVFYLQNNSIQHVKTSSSHASMRSINNSMCLKSLDC